MNTGSGVVDNCGNGSEKSPDWAKRGLEGHRTGLLGLGAWPLAAGSGRSGQGTGRVFAFRTTTRRGCRGGDMRLQSRAGQGTEKFLQTGERRYLVLGNAPSTGKITLVSRESGSYLTESLVREVERIHTGCAD